MGDLLDTQGKFSLAILNMRIICDKNWLFYAWGMLFWERRNTLELRVCAFEHGTEPTTITIHNVGE